MNKRINVILNGKRDLNTVINNLKGLFTSEDKILLYTKSELSEVKECFKTNLNIDETAFDEKCTYAKFNKYDKKDYLEDTCKKYSIIKMPNNLFYTISTALNNILDFCDDTDIAQFIHFFYDDVKMKTNVAYSPEKYEWFMEEFNQPFIMDEKMNNANFAFKKLSPRFIFVSVELKSPVSFFMCEGRDHFIIDRTRNDLRFDEKVKRLYIIEYIMRAFDKKIVKHFTFYPDPTLEIYFERDNNILPAVVSNELISEYRSDDDYIRNTLKKNIIPESSVDPIISEMVEVIKTSNGGDVNNGTEIK